MLHGLRGNYCHNFQIEFNLLFLVAYSGHMEWYDGSQRDITGDFLTCLNCLWLQATLLGERERGGRNGRYRGR